MRFFLTVCLYLLLLVSPAFAQDDTSPPEADGIAEPKTAVAYQITESKNPFTAPVTALAKDEKRMAIGLPDGGIVLCDFAGTSGLVIRLPIPAAPTKRILLGKDEAAWQSGTTRYTFRYKERTGYQKTFAEADETDFTPDTSQTAKRTQYEIRLPDGTVISTRYKADYPGGSGAVVFSPNQVWWTTGAMLFRNDRQTGKTEAYLPWAGAGGTIRAIVAEQNQVWTATDKGVRHFRATDSTFDGYVRARLDETEETPVSMISIKMNALITEWQGVPYLWGGQTKAGCDCSGYVNALMEIAEITIPRTSGAIARAGRPVTGDLRWGDIICLPGHVAFYIGNGKTTEALGSPTTGGAVGKATIWNRTNATARRFLKD